MSFTMVQTDFNCQVFRYSSQGLRVTDKLSSDQILFLNKNDLFERKIRTSDIKSFFPVSLFPCGKSVSDTNRISIRISTANREIPRPVGITLNDDSRSLHRKLAVLRTARFTSSKSRYIFSTKHMLLMIDIVNEKYNDGDGYGYAAGSHGCS